MRRIVLAIAVFAFAAGAFAQRVEELNGRRVQLHPTNEHAANPDPTPGWAKPGGGSAQNVINHGGPVIANATVIAIYWGSEWSGTGSATASAMNGFFQNFGSTGEYKTVQQYGIQMGLQAGSWVDSTNNPPTNATDAAVQGEVRRYLSVHGLAGDPNTIYEVFLPSTSYASYGTDTSCGGPNLQFCAYHSNFFYNGVDVKYASMPYPRCSGCHASGFSPVQDLQHFACHETREAVTDPDGTTWFDRRGYEADDKCAWSPAPFIGSGGYGYQWEWSNAAGGCVQRVN